MDKLGDFVGVANRKALLPIFYALVIVGAAALIPLNKVNDESVKYFDTSSEFRQAADFMEQTVSGMTTISIAVKTNESQAIADPVFLQAIGDFTDWLRVQWPTMWPRYLMSTCVWTKNIRRWRPGLLPNCRLTESWPRNTYCFTDVIAVRFGLNNQISVDKSSSKWCWRWTT